MSISAFEMNVTRVAEAPRVTKPFADDAWAALDALGEQVDRDLVARRRAADDGRRADFRVDRRFRRRRNGTPPPSARRNASCADELIRRLRDRFAPGGLLHYGQGKWYPGESLPRWAFSLYWRRDGKPIWRNPDLIARETKVEVTKAARARKPPNASPAISRDHLGFDRTLLRRPLKTPAMDHRGRQSFPAMSIRSIRRSMIPKTRARMVRIFERGLSKPTGYVLPVQRWNAEAERRWQSEKWQFRRGKLFLVPGDSPVGYRLPLSSLPYVRAVVVSLHHRPGPDGAARPAARPPAKHAASAGASAAGQRAPGACRTASGLEGAVRTAVSVEPRDGKLCVFMPPVDEARRLSRSDRRASNRRARAARCRFTSKVMRRRTIRGSTSSRSRPTPA